MDGRGRALDNVFVEHLWRSLKYEEVYLKDYESVLAAVAGLLWMSRLQIGVPTIGERGWLLPSFAIVVIGGCILEGGAVSIVGVVLAAILLAIIENGILINRVDPFWVEFLLGAMILIAVGIGRVNRGSFSVRRPRRRTPVPAVRG